VRESIGRVLHEDCAYCEGKGFIKTATTICYEIFREIRREAPGYKDPTLVINCHPDVARLLQGEERLELRHLMDRYNKSIQVKAQANYHREQYDIYGRSAQGQDHKVSGSTGTPQSGGFLPARNGGGSEQGNNSYRDRERGDRERGDRERGERERGERERGERERGDRERGDRERGDRERGRSGGSTGAHRHGERGGDRRDHRSQRPENRSQEGRLDRPPHERGAQQQSRGDRPPQESGERSQSERGERLQAESAPGESPPDKPPSES